MEVKGKMGRRMEGRMYLLHAITFWGLYTCVALIVPPANIAQGATMKATLKKSIADLYVCISDYKRVGRMNVRT